ncbi:hypothetical protein [Burkholderia multivorans]|uniref:hypothetical protein n=1 Tax=Burkholderia multivorans TaxID=87883 RepID=UPI0009E0DBCE|nr:hypothetical protein [Burkholderia multivorans]SAJ89233.1 hypothetical protein UA11_04055 [Burkholderia multivorans]
MAETEMLVAAARVATVLVRLLVVWAVVKSRKKLNKEIEMDRIQWLPNHGFVPAGVRFGVAVETIRKDGTRCISTDYDHRDLWAPEKHGSGSKDVMVYRILD